MKKMRLFSTGFILFIVMSGCSQLRYSVIMPEYQKNPVIKGKTLAVCFDYSNLAVSKDSSLTKCLGPGDPENVFKQFFTENMVVNLYRYSYFSRIEAEAPANPEDLEPTDLTVNKNMNMTFEIPEKGKKFLFNQIQPDFVLLLETTDVGERLGPGTDRQDSKSGSSKSMVGGYVDINCGYLLWDNRAEKIVSYGKGRTSTKIFITMDRTHWENTIKDFAHFLLEKTPFDKVTTY